MNLSPGKEDFFNIGWVKVKFCEVGEGAIRPPLNYYTKIKDGCAILRSLYSEISTKYDINCGKQTVPMCLTALAYNKLKPSRDWTKADMDEILNKGNDFYTETMNDILKRELNPENRDDDLITIPTMATGMTAGTVATTATTATTAGTTGAVATGGTTKAVATTGTTGTVATPGTPETGTSKTEAKENEGDKYVPEEDGLVDSNNVNKEVHIGLNKITIEFENVAEGN